MCKLLADIEGDKMIDYNNDSCPNKDESKIKKALSDLDIGDANQINWEAMFARINQKKFSVSPNALTEHNMEWLQRKVSKKLII